MAPEGARIVAANMGEGASEMAVSQLERVADEEERRSGWRTRRGLKLEEMRVRLRGTLKLLEEKRVKVVRRHCESIMDECSSVIANYYKSIDAKELSTHIKSRFDAWDADHSHALDAKELTEAMAAMGKRPTSEEVGVLMLRVDKDGNGTVELDEFEHMVRESLGLHLESCGCRMCVKDRTEAAENEAAEHKEAARLAAEAA